MLDSLLHYLRSTHGPLAYALIAVSAGLEYLVPFYPGNTITLVAVSLAVTSGYSPPLVYAMLVVGSLAGGLAAYAFGRTLPADPQHGPRLLRGPRAQRALGVVRDRFAKRGHVVLVIHRFIPVLRGLAFVGAGAARVPPRELLLYGGLGIALFNGALFALAYLARDQWQAWVGTLEQYSVPIGAAVLIAVGVWLISRMRRKTGSLT